MVGLLVGMTGVGGGALMTPMLVLIFSVKPAAAISSDLVAAVAMRPVGSAVHLRRGTVNLRLAGWIAFGSVPAALGGSYVLHLLAQTQAATGAVEGALGAALVLGAGAMILRDVLRGRHDHERQGNVENLTVRPVPSVAVGAVGGFLVGMTSVGAGSLMIVLLVFVYPTLATKQLVGTDLVQAVPLTAAAALGASMFGNVQFALTASIAIGSIPAVFIGSLLSSRATDRILRPAISIVVLATGLRYLGLSTAPLAWTLLAVLVAAIGGYLVRIRPGRQRHLAPDPVPEAATGPGPPRRK